MPFSGTYSKTPKALTDPEMGFREGGDFQNGLFADVPYWVAWEDRYAFANEVLGTSEWLGAGAWNRVVPHAYPPSPNMYAQAVQIRGAGEELNDPDYDQPVWTDAVVLVSYRTPQTTFSAYGGLGDTLATTPEEEQALLWAEQEIDTATETYTLPREKFQWLATGKESTVNRWIGLPVQTMRLTYHRLPIIPMRIVGNYMGRLNDREFFGCPRGTVQFLPTSTRRQFDTSGLARQAATLTFKYRPVNWNYDYDPDSGQWDKLVTKVGARGRHAYANFLKLLNFIEFNASDVVDAEDAILWG